MMSTCLLLLFTLIIVGNSHKLHCNYDFYEYNYIGKVYHCVDESLKIESIDDREITSVSTDGSDEADDDAEGVWCTGRTVRYFPQNLKKFFKNMKTLVFDDNGLNEIHKEDLNLFDKLEFLSLWTNNIEILEKDLFSGNPELKYISLGNNRIKYIDEVVFDKLDSLATLHLQHNICIDERSDDDYGDTRKLISNTKQKCKTGDKKESDSLELIALKDTVEKLKIKVQNISTQHENKIQKYSSENVELTLQNKNLYSEVEKVEEEKNKYKNESEISRLRIEELKRMHDNEKSELNAQIIKIEEEKLKLSIENEILRSQMVKTQCEDLSSMNLLLKEVHEFTIHEKSKLLAQNEECKSNVDKVTIKYTEVVQNLNTESNLIA